MGTKASHVVAHIDAMQRFQVKIRIEKLGGNRRGANVNSLRHLCFSDEKKMRFSKGEVVSKRMKIRSKATNVTEVNEKNS